LKNKGYHMKIIMLKFIVLGQRYGNLEFL